MKTVPFNWQQQLIDEYLEYIHGKSFRTQDAYQRALYQFTNWLIEAPGSQGQFRPELLTRSAFEIFIGHLKKGGYSVSSRERMKAAVSGFAQWLITEKGLLNRNPTTGVRVPAEGVLAPRELELEQRFVLRTLVERTEDLRGEAIFALGYWAGCRVSDISWLRMEHTHVGPKIGWLHVGYKGGKFRDIDVLNEARRPLYEYIKQGDRDPDSPYVFTSRRSERLSEDGIHNWFQKLKVQATKEEWDLIHDLTFHDLRHDFAHRARQSGWSLEELAYYLGHITQQGSPAIQTTARYTQVSRKQIKEKLQLLKE